MDRLADSLTELYHKKAAAVDRGYGGVREGELGPVESRLREYGDVLGWVFGGFGEGSAGAHELVQRIAKARVEKEAFQLGRGGRRLLPAGALAVAVGQVRRRLFTTATRAQARLLLDRLPYVGPGGAAASERRRASKLQREAEFRNEQEAQYWQRASSKHCRGGGFKAR